MGKLQSNSQSMTQKILLDTDIGSDIDDAVALAYLLAQPQCNLLGITTVSGEPHRRAAMASAMCRVAGRDIPIRPGTEPPLLVTARQPLAPQADALVRWPHEADFPHNEAVAFMRKTIRDNPGEVILLAIGPLTNVALLFALDPEIPKLLKGLHLMAGRFIPDRPPKMVGGNWEWNIWCDPHAAAMVYRAPVAIHRSVGLDVTMRVTMDAAQVRQRFQTKLLHPVLDFAEVWFRTVQKITFHDPLAAATIFNPDLCVFDRGFIEIELHDPDTYAVSGWRPGSAGMHELATAVEPERFFEHYFGVVGMV